MARLSPALQFRLWSVPITLSLLLAASLGPEDAFRRRGDDEVAADRRSATLARRRDGGLHGADGGRREQHASPRRSAIVPLAGGRPGRSPRKARQRARPLVARLQADRLRLRPRRLLADLDDGRRRLQRQTDHEPLHRSRRRDLVPPDGKNLVFTSEVYPECAPTTPATRSGSTPKTRAR